MEGNSFSFVFLLLLYFLFDLSYTPEVMKFQQVLEWIPMIADRIRKDEELNSDEIDSICFYLLLES